MSLVLDMVERAPMPVLLGAVIGGAALSLVIAGLTGGSIAITALALGAIVVLTAGGMLALRVHLARMPLELGPVALASRIDGHPAYSFRARLGRGRLMRDVRARVRFLPDHGEPVELEPVVPTRDQLLGAWTVVVIDREGRCRGPGAFEVEVEAGERSKRWAASQAYPPDQVRPGRFQPPVILRKGRLILSYDAWNEVRPAAIEESEQAS